MTSHFHNGLAKHLAELNLPPKDPVDFNAWLSCKDQLALALNQDNAEEIILYAAGTKTFIHAAAFKSTEVNSRPLVVFLEWNGNASGSGTHINWSNDGDVWLESGGAVILDQNTFSSERFVFGRQFSDTSEGRFKYEILQSLIHALDLHEVPERRSYCRLDGNGDYDDVVSITYGNFFQDQISLVTIKRDALESYLLLSDLSLVQMFDFTLTGANFAGWDHDRTPEIVSNESFAYRQHEEQGHASYTRGLRLHRSNLTKKELWLRLQGVHRPVTEHQTFIAFDFRHKAVREISTDPTATTNYFEADKNDLPFELSPAFFRPDVLLKYKADRDKYRLEGRSVRCRAGWELRSYDLNSAGQVHAYICDLRNLPTPELLHWKAHNVEPIAPISKRAYKADFLGEWSDDPDPIGSLANALRSWDYSQVPWWSVRDPDLLARISPPVTTSRDEWSNAFRDLHQLVIEGIDKSYVAGLLRSANVAFEPQFGSIKLYEALWDHAEPDDGGHRLTTLREIIEIRNKTGAHAAKNEAARLAADALAKHESFLAHFEEACRLALEELHVVEALCRRFAVSG